MTLDQAVESAKYGGMPRSAIAAGAIDVIRPVIQMRDQLLENVLSNDSPFQDFLIDQDFPSIGRKVLALKTCCLHQRATIPARILLVIEDLTEREQAKEQ